jgi:hypothetical protein
VKPFPVESRDVLHIGAVNRRTGAIVACTVGQLLEACGVRPGTDTPIELLITTALHRQWRKAM